MKKQNKVYLSLALAAMLLCALSVTAFATETGDDPSDGHQQAVRLYLWPHSGGRDDPAGLGYCPGGAFPPEPRPQPAVQRVSHLGGRHYHHLYKRDPGPHYWLIEKGGDICCPLPFLKGWIDNRCVRIEYDESERYLPPQ